MTDEEKQDWAKIVPQAIYVSPEAYWEFIDALENPEPPTPALIALMRGEEYIAPEIQPHRYEPEENCAIGFCKICLSDNEDSFIHKV